MQTVNELFSAFLEEKKSTFLSFLCPIAEFESLHVKLKNEHPKAAHIVWAKRFFNEYKQIVENSSDNGEPKGTSGPPVLNVMRGFELVDVGIFIVRYFGGIKLGTGGLVRAYGRSAKEVIAAASLQPFVFKEALSFHIGYPLLPRFEHYLTLHTIDIGERTFDTSGVLWNIWVSEEEKEAFLDFAHPYERESFKKL